MSSPIELWLTHPDADTKVADQAEGEDSCHESDDCRRGAAVISPESLDFGGREDWLFDGHA